MRRGENFWRAVFASLSAFFILLCALPDTTICKNHFTTEPKLARDSYTPGRRLHTGDNSSELVEQSYGLLGSGKAKKCRH